jgi:hypothetical protein
VEIGEGRDGVNCFNNSYIHYIHIYIHTGVLKQELFVDWFGFIILHILLLFMLVMIFMLKTKLHITVAVKFTETNEGYKPDSQELQSLFCS